MNKSYQCGHSHGDKSKIPKNTVSINSHYTNKFVDKEIPTSYNKFNCLNIDKDIDIIDDTNNNDVSNNNKSD